MSEAKTGLGPALAAVTEKVPLPLRPRVETFLGTAVDVIGAMADDLINVHVNDDGTMDQASAMTVRAAVPLTMLAVRNFMDGTKTFVPKDPGKETNRELAAAYELIANCAQTLEREVGTLEQKMRDPAVTNDLWQLVDLVAVLRGRTRYAAGDMIFFLCHAFEDGRKEDYVPSYGGDVDNSVEVRHGVTELRQQVRICVSTMGAVPNAQVPERVAQLSEELTAFYRGDSYRCMRVPDKRSLVTHHQAIKALLADPRSTTGQFIKCIDAVMLFFESLLAINRRALLISHDKQMVMAARDHLFNAIEGFLTSTVPLAVGEFSKSLQAIQAVFGRDTNLDNLLMAYRHITCEMCPQGDMLGAAEAMLAAVDRMEDF